MERNALDLLNQLRMTKQLCKCLDTRVMDFGIVDGSRSIKEQDITIQVKKCAEGVNEVVLFDEEMS